jgi:hypothetical protein
MKVIDEAKVVDIIDDGGARRSDLLAFESTTLGCWQELGSNVWDDTTLGDDH